MKTVRNGASIICEAPRFNFPETKAVLCRTTDGELVSWVVDDDYNCFWGYYGDSAVPTFCDRTGLREDIVRLTFNL